MVDVKRMSGHGLAMLRVRRLTPYSDKTSIGVYVRPMTSHSQPHEECPHDAPSSRSLSAEVRGHRDRT